MGGPPRARGVGNERARAGLVMGGESVGRESRPYGFWRTAGAPGTMLRGGRSAGSGSDLRLGPRVGGPMRPGLEVGDLDRRRQAVDDEVAAAGPTGRLEVEPDVQDVTVGRRRRTQQDPDAVTGHFGHDAAKGAVRAGQLRADHDNPVRAVDEANDLHERSLHGAAVDELRVVDENTQVRVVLPGTDEL